MLKRMLAIAFIASGAYAEETPITGTVQSACSIYTTKAGVYGLPSIDKLSTAPADGGVHPIVRVDTTLAGSYIARITTPSSFSSSPSLNDSLNWAGNVSVSQVSDPAMGNYDADKVTYNNTHEYGLAVVGSTWFEIESSVEYGVNKPLPGGSYVAKVMVECIAN